MNSLLQIPIPQVYGILPNSKPSENSGIAAKNGVTFSWNNLNVYSETNSFMGKIKSKVHIVKNGEYTT